MSGETNMWDSMVSFAGNDHTAVNMLAQTEIADVFTVAAAAGPSATPTLSGADQGVGVV